MAALVRRRLRLVWLGVLSAVLAELVGAVLIVSLVSTGSAEAGWRHELIATALAALAVYSATWMQDRPWPQPGAIFVTEALILETLAIVMPLERLAALTGLALATLVIGAVALPLEWLASRGRSRVLRAAVLVAMVEAMAITPTFLVLLAAGLLR